MMNHWFTGMNGGMWGGSLLLVVVVVVVVVSMTRGRGKS